MYDWTTSYSPSSFTPTLPHIKTTALVVGIIIARVVDSDARPMLGKHTATDAKALSGALAATTAFRAVTLGSDANFAHVQ